MTTPLKIVSNSYNKIGKINYTNDFTMSLQQPIDAENKTVYIKPLKVCYPLRTNNVNDESCYFYCTIEFSNFKSDTHIDVDDANPEGSTSVTFKSKKCVLPVGIYSVEDIVNFFNHKVEQYGVHMEQVNNAHIQISVSYEYRFCYNQKTSDEAHGLSFESKALNIYHYGDVVQNNIVGGMRVDIVFSDKLYHMLGEFENAVDDVLDGSTVYNLTFLSGNNEEKKRAVLSRDRNVEIQYSKRIPNPYDGINLIYIYCDQVEKTIVGDTMLSVLCSVPLQYKGQGSVELASFIPAPVPLRLIKQNIKQFDVQLRDAKGDLINFDSGSVTIECIYF